MPRIDVSALQVREDLPEAIGERNETRHVVTAQLLYRRWVPGVLVAV